MRRRYWPRNGSYDRTIYVLKCLNNIIVILKNKWKKFVTHLNRHISRIQKKINESYVLLQTVLELSRPNI